MISGFRVNDNAKSYLFEVDTEQLEQIILDKFT